MIWKFTIIQNSIETVIDEPPGWDTIGATIARDPEMHGIFYDFSQSSLQFADEAYWIIKEAYALRGVDASIGIRIEWICDECEECDGWNEFYEGRLDFQRYVESQGLSCYVTVGLEASETEVMIKNRMDTSVDITSNKAYDGTTVIPTYAALNKFMDIPGKAVMLLSWAKVDAIQRSADFVQDSQWIANTVSGQSSIIRAQIIPAFNKIIYTDLKDTSFIPDAGLVNGGNTNQAVCAPVVDVKAMSNLKCVTSDVLIEYRFKGDFEFTDGPLGETMTSAGARYIINKLPAGMADISANYVMLVNRQCTGAFDIDGVVTTTLNERDKLFSYFRIFVTDGAYSSWVFIEHPGTFFKVTIKTECDVLPCKTSLIHEVGSRLIEHITNNRYRFKSHYYGRTDSEPFLFQEDGCGALRALLNGMQLRCAVLADGTDPKAFISMKEFYGSLNAIDCVGMGIEGTNVIMEPLKYFYRDDIIFTCDGVDELTYAIKNDRIYNQFNFGFDKFETETTNGLDAMHTKREYRTDIIHSDKPLDKTSKIIADGYAIEVTRRKFGATEDWRYDQNMFILCLKRVTGALEVEQGNIYAPKNMYDPPTVFNYAITPVRNAMRWFSWLTQGVRGISPKMLFNKGEGNYVAQGRQNTGCIIEQAVLAENETISKVTFYDPADSQTFIKADSVKFKYPIGINEFMTISAKKYGKIQYRRYETEDWKYGWIEQVVYQPEEGAADFTLTLCK